MNRQPELRKIYTANISVCSDLYVGTGFSLCLKILVFYILCVFFLQQVQYSFAYTPSQHKFKATVMVYTALGLS